MKKKFLSGVFTLALLAMAGFGVNKSMKSDANLSNLALVNVEALANGEGTLPYCTISTPCGGGVTLSCSGKESCKASSGSWGGSGNWVECDGKKYTYS